MNRFSVPRTVDLHHHNGWRRHPSDKRMFGIVRDHFVPVERTPIAEEKYGDAIESISAPKDVAVTRTVEEDILARTVDIQKTAEIVIAESDVLDSIAASVVASAESFPLSIEASAEAKTEEAFRQSITNAEFAKSAVMREEKKKYSTRWHVDAAADVQKFLCPVYSKRSYDLFWDYTDHLDVGYKKSSIVSCYKRFKSPEHSIPPSNLSFRHSPVCSIHYWYLAGITTVDDPHKVGTANPEQIHIDEPINPFRPPTWASRSEILANSLYKVAERTFPKKWEKTMEK